MQFLLNLILFFLFLGLIINLFVRYVLPWLITRYIKKHMGDYENGQKDTEDEAGNTRVIYSSQQKDKKQKPNPDEGEYVDFEEVDD